MTWAYPLSVGLVLPPEWGPLDPPVSSHCSETPVAIAQTLIVMGRTRRLPFSALLIVPCETPIVSANSRTQSEQITLDKVPKHVLAWTS